MGRWLLESFLAANREHALGAKVTVLTRSPERFAGRFPHLGTERSLAVRRWEMTRGALPEGAYTHLVHAATAEGYPSQVAQAEALVRGTLRLVRCAVERGSEGFLLVSTGAVYDRPGRGSAPIREADPVSCDALVPGRFYGEVRRFLEVLCREAAEGSALEVKLARGFGFVGPGMRMDGRFAIMDFIAAATAGEPVVIHSRGRARRSYLYASDMAVWLWTVLFNGEPGRPYNVGSEEAITIAHAARQVANSAGGGVPVVIQGQPEPLVQRVNYVPDTGRARSELGLRARVNFERAIRKTLTYDAGGPLSAHRRRPRA